MRGLASPPGRGRASGASQGEGWPTHQTNRDGAPAPPADPAILTAMPPIEAVMDWAERALRISVTILATYLAALWISAIWWTLRDIRSRTTDVWLQVSATLLVTVFSFPGAFLYFILRPQRTLAEDNIEFLEGEAWRRSVADTNVCPSCQRPIEADFLFCPWCQVRLRRSCPRCERPISLRWKLCPYCGSSTGASIMPAPQNPRASPEP